MMRATCAGRAAAGDLGRGRIGAGGPPGTAWLAGGRGDRPPLQRPLGLVPGAVPPLCRPGAGRGAVPARRAQAFRALASPGLPAAEGMHAAGGVAATGLVRGRCPCRCRRRPAAARRSAGGDRLGGAARPGHRPGAVAINGKARRHRRTRAGIGWAPEHWGETAIRPARGCFRFDLRPRPCARTAQDTGQVVRGDGGLAPPETDPSAPLGTADGGRGTGNLIDGHFACRLPCRLMSHGLPDQIDVWRAVSGRHALREPCPWPRSRACATAWPEPRIPSIRVESAAIPGPGFRRAGGGRRVAAGAPAQPRLCHPVAVRQRLGLIRREDEEAALPPDYNPAWFPPMA